MSDLAKKARAAMKSKAERLGASRPMEKVSSADWSPPELLNADVKTGMRPVSRRAFKKGGKVAGDACAPRADRKPRKAGGRAEEKSEAKEYALAKVNRNVKEANEDREGIKHVGGLKRGGRAKKAEGGGFDVQSMLGLRPLSETKPFIKQLADNMKKGGRAKKQAGGGNVPLPPPRPKSLDEKRDLAKQADMLNQIVDKDYLKELSAKQQMMAPRKDGGRAKKQAGGDLAAMSPGMIGAAKMMKGAGRAGVPSSRMQFAAAQRGALSPVRAVSGSGMKKGGKAEDYKSLRTKGGTQVMSGSYKKGGEAHADEAMDKALIKKMVKPEARKGKNIGGMLGGLIPMAIGAMSGKDKDEKKHGGSAKHPDEAMDKALIKKMVKVEARKGRATGGEVFSGSGYPNKVPGVVPGGRTARKAGGRAKGKTNINIVIAAGKPAGGPDMMKPPSNVPTDNRGAGGIPVPVSMPPGGPGGMPGGGMPMPMPIPMPMAGGPPVPPGGTPMPRKSGGRVTKVASSYKDMQAGAGSGEGRLQKTDIAKKGKGAPAYKAGGKVYRSYKDMDAGAGSGRGRLEKTEIEARKH